MKHHLENIQNLLMLPKLHIESDSPPRYVPDDLDSISLTQTASFDDHLYKSFYDKSRDVPPIDDEKYLDNKEFHYTSSFQIRPQVEYFDFDERYMFKPNQESAKGEEIHDVDNDTAQEVQDAGQRVLQEVVEDLQLQRENTTYSRDDYLDGMALKVDLCKRTFQGLIEKIDSTTFSTTTYQNTKQDIPVAKEISSLLSMVNYNNLLQSLISGEIDRPQEADSKIIPLSSSSGENPGKLGKLLRDDPCASLPNFGVILLKSPASIAQLWDEYTKVPAEWPVTDILSFTRQQGILNSASNIELVAKRKTSIRQLEELLGSSWRNDDKNFSRQINRRKKIWKAIEDGLRDGVPLQECFSILETYVKERNKGLSWYYNGVPFALAAMSSTKE